MQLSTAAFPGLYQAADNASLAAQRRYLAATRLRLAFVVIAAATGAISFRLGPSFDLAAAVTTTALVGALAVEVWLLSDRPELTWYDGRALAESVKTLTWRFAVGGAPFELTSERIAAEEQFLGQIAKLLDDAPRTSIHPTTGAALSAEIVALRKSSLAQRKEAYISGRIGEQNDWYAKRSEWNRRRASKWRSVLIIGESIGAVAALLRATGILSVDLAGIFAALVASGIAWVATKQHDSLGRAYAYAANELAIIRGRFECHLSEHRWALEVANAEEAISREHTMWRASRSSIHE